MVVPFSVVQQQQQRETKRNAQDLSSPPVLTFVEVSSRKISSSERKGEF